MILVSIIIASYNKQKFISETINSVLTQSYKNWELVIVDDNSTDGTVVIIKDLINKDKRIKLYENKKNRGANYCRNYGIKVANGEFLIFLDADDLLMSFCLEQRIKEVHLRPNEDLYVFPMGVFKKKIGDITLSNWIPPHNESDFLSLFLLHKLPWSICQPIWKKSFLESIAGFNENFIRLQDVELHTRALINKAKIATFPLAQIDCYYRIDEGRNELNSYEFMTRFIKGSISYYNDFFSQVNTKYKKQMVGSLLEPLSVLCYHRRKKKISHEQAQELGYKLINACQIPSQKRILKWFYIFNKISPIHPKGLKKLTLSFI